MKLSLRQIANALGGEVSGNQVLAPGPGHSAKDRSLAVKLNECGDDIIVHSHAGNDPITCKDYVRERCGMPGWKPNGATHINGAANRPRVVATYIYPQADGTPYLRVQRTDTKAFWQSHWNGAEWVRGKPPGPKIPYRLPDFARFPGAPIYIVEGEKDANRLATDLLATTASEGAGKWTSDLNEHFRGREVYILPDNDEPGRKHAGDVATHLHGIAAKVVIVTLPGLPDKGDVSDWLNAGGSLETLGALCLDAPPFAAEPPPLDNEPLLHRRTNATPEAKPRPDLADGVGLDDFYAYMPRHAYIYIPTREMWPATSVNARILPIPMLDSEGKQKTITAATWLDQNRSVEQMTWAPGESELINDRHIADGGWIARKGVACFNLYRPPTIVRGNANLAGPWFEHVHTVYGQDGEHIIRWLAHRVQHPEQKINHALVLGGNQGIGKDTMLEPVKQAVGPWNFFEVSPQQVQGRFNGFLKSVILRVSEARDLGDVDRFQFYDHMKAYTASPPDVLRVDEKHLNEHNVLNCVGIIITSNYKSDGIFLPADDRRHFVAWSSLTKDDFSSDYWNKLWRWYRDGGDRHVAAHLAELDLSAFNPKAPPPKTAAFWDIVDANRAPEDAELADVLDSLNCPDAITIERIGNAASGDFQMWIKDRKNRRKIPHRLEKCGYVQVRNDCANDGLWKINGARQAVYCRGELSIRDRMQAAADLASR
jgi:hypothetical protein